MGVLRVTLDSWQDMAQLDPTPPGGAPGDAVRFHAACSPSLTGGAVLDSLGAGHAVTREEHAGLSAPWQIDLLDPTGCTPSGWGWRVDVLTAIGRRATALLGPEMIADLPVVDGVRTVDLAQWLGLGDPLPSGVVTAGAAGVAAVEAAASAEAAALSATAASSSASSASGSATTATSAASTATSAASSASGSASAAASSASAASGSANAAATSAVDAATARDEAQALVDTTVTSGEVVGDDLILKRADETTVNAGNVRGHPSTVPGPPGREVELRTTATHVQWRYVGDAAWTDLVPLASITGDDGLSVELQTTATHIQWRLVGGDWADLVALSALVGPAGPPNELAIGTVTTGAPGSAAAASITGTAPSQVLNLTIPTGATGAVSAWEYYAAGRPDIVDTLDPAALAWRNAAPSGSTFYSTDGTQGAWVWRKRGATWVCVEGDTGWRKLVTWDAAGTITYGTLPAGIEPSGYAGGIEVRRTGDRVDVALKCSRLTAASSGSIATGFLCYDAFNLVPIASADATRDFWVRANAAGVLVVGQHPSGWAATNLGAGGVYATAVASFPARPAWPTTLPGSPA